MRRCNTMQDATCTIAGFGAAPRNVCRQGAVPRWRVGPGRLVHNRVRCRQRVHGLVKRCRRRRVLSARPHAVAQRVDGRVGVIHKDETSSICPLALPLNGLALGQRHVSACLQQCRSACARVWSMSTSLRSHRLRRQKARPASFACAAATKRCVPFPRHSCRGRWGFKRL
jgi:hypothetical protein